MGRPRRKNKTEEQRQAGREAKLERAIERALVKSPLPPFTKGGVELDYTLDAQARALRGIERRIYGA